MIYQIMIKGTLDQSWSDWLGNVKIATGPAENGAVITTIRVDATDQSALFGILDHIRDLNLDLLNVARCDTEDR